VIEEKGELRKELAAVREKRKRIKMAGGGGRLDGKDENDRGKYRKNRDGSGRIVRRGDRGETERKESI
jgi:hypothetical protein